MAQQRRRPRRFAQALVLGRVLGEYARPAAPMRSGMRAPVDSPEHDERHAALGRDACFTCRIFFMLIDARRCAEHGEVIGHERDLAAGDAREARDLPVGRRLVLTSGRCASCKSAGFVNFAGSTRYSMRSRAFRKPSALRARVFPPRPSPMPRRLSPAAR